MLPTSPPVHDIHVQTPQGLWRTTLYYTLASRGRAALQNSVGLVELLLPALLPQPPALPPGTSFFLAHDVGALTLEF